jgi:hypothetical protein
MKYILERNYSEILLYYNIRKIFIEYNNPKTEKKFKLYEMYSNILISMIFLKCRFSKKTEKIIIDFIKKNKDKILFLNYVHNNIIYTP